MDNEPKDALDGMQALEARLRAERPEATATELDRMRRRAVAQASAPAGAWVPRKGLFMKPRIAVVFVLALGLLMSGTGATLAVMSDTNNAGSAQYPEIGAADEGENLVAPQQDPAPEAEVQEERQVATTGGGQELPFTGFLAIPLLILGVLLLVAGGFMRSRARVKPDA